MARHHGEPSHEKRLIGMHELSIVIPCKDDPRVLDCVRSIDVPCDVRVIINGSTDEFVAEYSSRLHELGAVVEVLDDANLSAALEHGVWAAQHDAILFMDADCLFDTGAIALLTAAMDQYKSHEAVFKGMVCFEPGNGLLSKLISRSRHVHTAAPPTAYKPPLLVHRDLAQHIGGYFFNPRLHWKEDADLDWRLRQAGIAIIPVVEATIRHAALGVRADLLSNYRYGVGAALGEILGIPLTSPDRSLSHTYRSEGFAVAAYMSIANAARTLGYYWTLTTVNTEAHD